VRMLDRLFGKAEEINGRERCPTYLYRWTLIKRKKWSLYLHRFVGDDWSLDLHDHPKRFISMGLWGKYREERQTDSGIAWEVFSAPWLRTFPAEHRHRLSLIDGKSCWTLVLVLRAVRQWGFWHEGKFIQWREYVDSETADQMKACD
jgi:hypothetical protein